MNSLATLTTIVSTELGLYDDTSIALIKVYLNLAYSTIWDKYPWADTHAYEVKTVDAGFMQTTLPADMERIISIRARNFFTGEVDTPDFRADARMLEPVTTKWLFENDPSIFERGGFVKWYQEITVPTSAEKWIRLYPTPQVTTELVFYGKTRCPGFPGDSDVSAIRNIDQAILAYATADMLKRQRQYGKADLRYKTAQELEAVAWNLEQQQANQPRLTASTSVVGNTLLEMTDAVCVICGLWTPEYRYVIIEFLRRNYQSLYDSYLWPESLVMVQVPYTTEQVILPEYIDKVIGVRGSNNMRMFPADAGLLLDITPEVFDDIGEPISYTTLTPIGVATLPTSTTKLVIVSSSTIDMSYVMIRGEVLATGVQLEERVLLNGTTPVTSFYAYDTVLTAAKDLTHGTVYINAQNDSRLLVQLLPYQRESKHQRLWFLPAPLQNGSTVGSGDPDAPPPPPTLTTYYALVLGKRIIRPLLIDQDSPIITGAQQVLIAAAAADLYRKLEKHDMANAMLQKADGSMKVLKDKNTDQAASSPRFVPQIEPRPYVPQFGEW